jgi:pimeloyl-ACP methyl ester carboxylesterase
MLKAEGLEYESHGEGEPVLLIHGSHVADAFLPLTREIALAERYRLIRYHRRGFAGSDEHSGPFSIEEQARDALALLKHLGLDRAHVVGHSYGGVTSVQLALDAAHVVHSLVLLEPPLMTPDGTAAFFEAAAPLREAYRSGDTRGAVDTFLSMVGGPDWRTEVAKTVPGGPEQAEHDAATFFEVEFPALEKWFFDSELARRISQPVLFVVGSESGALFEEPLHLFKSSVPQTEESIAPGLNHLLQMRNPRIVAEAIADFLARQPMHRADEHPVR